MIDSVADEGGAAAADLKRSRRRKPALAESGKIDRLPPHSPEAEQGVLGCVMLSPNECMGECIEKFKQGAEVFYDLRHQTIFSALAEMYDQREAIDVITLQQRLKNKQLLEEVGGIAYLSSLPDAVPSAANLSYYLEIVQEKYFLRRMIQTCTDVVGRVYDYEGEVDALMDEVERDILRRGIEQLGNLGLRQPEGFIFKPALDARATVLRLVEDDAGLRLGFVAHGWVSGGMIASTGLWRPALTDWTQPRWG